MIDSMARGARGVNALAATYPRLLCWSAFSLAVAVALVAFWGPLHRFPGEDGAAYLQAAKDALDGHDLYSRTVPGGLFGFIYPPFAALIFMPLAWLPLAIGIPVWQCVVLVAVFVVARILARKLSPGAYA